MAKRKKLIIILIAAAVLIAVAVFVIWHIIREREKSTTLVLYGNVDIRQVELAFHGNQRIDRLYAVEGDIVRAGQLVGELDTSRLRPEALSAKAEVAAQQQVVARMLAGSRPEEIERDRAEVEAAKAELSDATAHYVRVQKAYKTDAATPQELTNA